MKLYYLIVSLGSLLGLCLSVFILSAGIINRFWMTDKEYIMNEQSHLWEQCNYLPMDSVKIIGPREASEEQIVKCQNKIIENVQIKRSFDFKHMFFTGIVRLVITLTLFVFHYPTMRRKYE